MRLKNAEQSSIDRNHGSKENKTRKYMVILVQRWECRHFNTYLEMEVIFAPIKEP